MCSGGLLTAARTGAASAIASRLLASAQSRCLGLVGAGAQALTQAHALSRVLPIDEILVHDGDDAHADSFERRAAFLECSVRRAGLTELVDRSDVICTATSVGVGEGQVLPARGYREHIHINAVGSDLVGKVELPVSLLRAAFVVPDHLAQAQCEGECQQLAAAEIGPDITHLCAAPEIATGYRERTSVFDSTGFAIEDHVALDVILELAGGTDIGDRLVVDSLLSDPLDPYVDVGRDVDMRLAPLAR